MNDATSIEIGVSSPTKSSITSTLTKSSINTVETSKSVMPSTAGITSINSLETSKSVMPSTAGITSINSLETSKLAMPSAAETNNSSAGINNSSTGITNPSTGTTNSSSAFIQCLRCKRVTHKTDECHAKKDILGSILSDFNLNLLKNVQGNKMMQNKNVHGNESVKNHFNNSVHDTTRKGSEKLVKKVPQKVSKKVSKKTSKNGCKNDKTVVKSKDCLQWIAGKCVLGDGCFYLHNPEKGFDPRSKQLCQFYRSGSCLKSLDCPFSHDKSKFACAFYHWKGGCTNENCCFSHHPITAEQLEEYNRDQEKFKTSRKKSEKNEKEDLLAIYSHHI